MDALGPKYDQIQHQNLQHWKHWTHWFDWKHVETHWKHRRRWTTRIWSAGQEATNDTQIIRDCSTPKASSRLGHHVRSSRRHPEAASGVASSSLERVGSWYASTYHILQPSLRTQETEWHQKANAHESKTAQLEQWVVWFFGGIPGKEPVHSPPWESQNGVEEKLAHSQRSRWSKDFWVPLNLA